MTCLLICKPDRWLDPALQPRRRIKMYDLQVFFANMDKILQRLKVNYSYTPKFGKLIETQCTFIGHHTHGPLNNNTWHTKKGYIPGFVYFDRTGYSGWAEIANSQTLFDASQQVDTVTARDFLTPFAQDYILNNRSKISQNKSDSFLRPDAPYVFVAGQIPTDSVQYWADIKSDDLIRLVANTFKNTRYTVIYKPHPIDYDKRRSFYNKLAKTLPITISHGSVHQIIKDATAVFTINSGVGFEALLHNKPVFCSGHSDYHWVTHRIKKADDIKNFEEKVKKTDITRIQKYMYYMLKNYFVECDNLTSIQNRIEQVLKEAHQV